MPYNNKDNFSHVTLVEARHFLEIMELKSEKIELILKKEVETLYMETIAGGFWKPCGLTLIKTNLNGYKGIFVWDIRRNSRAAQSNIQVTDSRSHFYTKHF